MRILLVNAPTYGAHLRGVPLGLLYLAATCRREGREIRLIDGCLLPGAAALDAEIAGEGFDVIGISAMTHNFPEALRIARLARRLQPQAAVVIGGAHASTVPEEVVSACPECLVVAGEGENAFETLLEALEKGMAFDSVPGLLWREGGRMRRNAACPVEDLDSLPFPAWDLADITRYTVGAHGLYFKRKPLTSMVTSRGCPFHCTFCAKNALTGDTWRARSTENVLEEIELLTRDYGVREIHFEDDNIALDEKRLVAICEGLLERGIDITWKCPHGIYASHLSDETFRLMARSGCYSLSFGIESGDDCVLAKAGKMSTTSSIRCAVEAAKRAGIHCVGFFIFGLEGETPATVRRTIDFAKSLPLDAAQFNLCVPFIGTPIRETYLRLGYVTADDLAAYDVDHATVNLPGLSARELKRWRLRAFLEFYGRPAVFLGNLRNLNSPDVVKALLYRLRNIWKA